MTRLTDAFLIDLVLRLANPAFCLTLHTGRTPVCSTIAYRRRWSQGHFLRWWRQEETSFMWYVLDTGLCFRVIRGALHLDSLNIRPAEDDQVVRLLRSSCNSAAWAGDFMDLKILVSSAKAAMWLHLTVPRMTALLWSRVVSYQSDCTRGLWFN